MAEKKDKLHCCVVQKSPKMNRIDWVLSVTFDELPSMTMRFDEQEVWIMLKFDEKLSIELFLTIK